MPTLDWKGKHHVYAHHLSVPYRPLVPDASKSVRPPPPPNKSSNDSQTPTAGSPDDNLIIHGDNLHALKALLPRYAGRVNCVYIDPPYNTGNEGWAYNDRVNSPLMKAWLKENGPVDGEDLERHDKWLCMMWPRLQLLRELLSDDGVIFVSIDDNEQHHLRMLMDEVFGEENFLSAFHWRKKGTSTNVRGADVSSVTDYQICYRKSASASLNQRVTRKETRKYPNSDAEGCYRTTIIEKKNIGSYARGTMQFQILGHYPREGRRWQIGQNTARKLEQRNRFVSDNGVVKLKIYDFEDKDTRSANPSLLPESCGSSDSANKSLIRILNDIGFETPKPVELIAHLLRMATDKDALVLDSFAGSGTTAHAVLALNKADGGSRRFILVECEEYADAITAERVRRVIRGVPAARDPALKEGLGGSFTYCELGQPIQVDGMLNGEALPTFSTLAAHLLHTASGVSAGAEALERRGRDGLFYSSANVDYHLLYEPRAGWLSSPDAMLNEERAKRISAAAKKRGRKAVVFGPGKYIGQRQLSGMGIVFCQLPYEMHRAGQ